MIARVFLALLALCLSLPAAAMPACASTAGTPMAAMPMADGGHHAPADAAPPHSCVGCVPIADWLGERVSAPVSPAADMLLRVPARLLTGSATPPALPPPRSA